MIGRRGITRGIASLAVGVLAATGARAAEGEFMRDTMSSIGLIEPERPPITYNERAPLVMPPSLGAKGAKGAGKKAGKPDPGAATGLEAPSSLALPPPQVRQVDPQWPKDPEIRRREREAIEARKPIVRGAQGRMNDNNMTLSVDEMQGGRRAGAGLSSDPAPGPGNRAEEASWLNPLQLLSGRKADAEPSAVEPEREGLTDPPTGYRKAPIKVQKVQGAPVGGSISGNEEADPRAYLRAQGAR